MIVDLNGGGERIRALEPRQKYVVLVLVILIAYRVMIASEALVLRPILDQTFVSPPDLPIYRQRASVLLNGGVH